MFLRVSSTSVIILFLRGLGFCVWRPDSKPVSLKVLPVTHGLCFSEFLQSSPLKKAPKDTASWCIQAAFLVGRCLYMRCATDTFLLELYLYFPIWVCTSGSLRWFPYHSDSPDWQISRCCQIPTGSKLPFIISPHFHLCFQQLCSLYARTCFAPARASCPASNFGFLAALSFLPSFPPSCHPQCFPQ